MTRSPRVRVDIDLGQIRRNTRAILKVLHASQRPVSLIAVVKADAYGCGARPVARAIADLVQGFYVFDLKEATAAELGELGLRTLVVQAESNDSSDYTALRAQPIVWTEGQAATLRRAQPVLSVDTGQQRFGVPLGTAGVEAVLRAGDIREAYTHATRLEQAAALSLALRERVPVLHAAGTALLHEPSAWLDAVRPGLALYQSAVTVTAPLVEVTDSTGPAGYTGFSVRRHGVILAGYSQGLRRGPCVMNGRPSRILEVGMQSAFVECEIADRVGDAVTLLGPGASETDVAAAWECSPQEVLVRMTGLGERHWREPAAE